MDRREFIRLMGLASSTTLLSSCGLDKGTEKLIPYLIPPEDGILPGEAVYVKTTCLECPAHCGVMAKVREGYPVKLEGIPGHPVNDGALCMRGQASLSRMYHPERISDPLMKGSEGNFRVTTWDDACLQVADALEAADNNKLSSYYLSGRTTGSLVSLIDTFCGSMNIQRLPEFELFPHANIREAAQTLFGTPVLPSLRIEEADFLLTVGADLLETFVSPVSYQRQIARAKQRGSFRWIHIEPHVSLTGLQAGTRMTIRPATEPVLFAYLLKALAGHGTTIPESILAAIPSFTLDDVIKKTGISSENMGMLIQGLTSAASPLIVAGGVSVAHHQGLETAVLCGLAQWASGQIGKTVDVRSAENYDRVGNMKDVRSLIDRLNEGKVGVLLTSRANPAPLFHEGDNLDFRGALSKASYRVGFGMILDDSLRECDIVLPLSHTLESWGDTHPRQGFMTLVQPAVSPLVNSHSEGDILLQLMSAAGREAGEGAKTYQEYLFGQWNSRYGTSFTQYLVDDGFIEHGQKAVDVELRSRATEDFLSRMRLKGPIETTSLVLTPSVRTYDGRSGSLPLMEEIPDPLTTITYGPWISIPEELASRFDIEDGDEVICDSGKWSTRLPIKMQSSLPPWTCTVEYGRSHAPPIEYDERSGEPMYVISATLSKAGASARLPILSGSLSQEGRGVIPNPNHHEKQHHHGERSVYPEPEHPVYRWAMVIDLDLCTGCSACVAACYIENNVPVVGKTEHLKGREMSWLRIEPYYEKDGRVQFLPMMCHHCSFAPCETVCPVYAAYHNPEGINAQIYNRCVGTRYCANNCPYKVRRFNWFDPKREGALAKMVNPDISTRGRGIMEKCTFCYQRIRAAKDRAKDDGRPVSDGEVIPACAQTCPSDAIHFGNMKDTHSKVYQLAHSDRVHQVFEHLGTHPAVYYLKKKG